MNCQCVWKDQQVPCVPQTVNIKGKNSARVKENLNVANSVIGHELMRDRTFEDCIDSNRKVRHERALGHRFI
jgi:hypothetical protein